MKKKSLSVKKKIRNSFLLNCLKSTKIKNIYREFEKSLNLYFNDKKIAVAVSGGPDSLSLSYFTACYALKRNLKVFYYIVDHKLRKNSTIEAKKVKSVLKILKGPCKILTWRQKEIKKNLQSLARENRYSLLLKQCKKDNIKTILLAHHIDDLYENFFIRLSRGSGLNGLLSFYETKSNSKEDLQIIRPLIHQKKKSLIYTANTVFKFNVKDPSNYNQKFKRVRLRRLISAIKEEGFDEKKFKLTLSNLNESNKTIKHYVRKNILLNSRKLKKKGIYILKNKFFNEPQEIVFRSFAQILKEVGQKYYNSRGKSISFLLKKITDKTFNKATLGGCVIEKLNTSFKISKENIKKV